jgi:hypothetical protein
MEESMRSYWLTHKGRRVFVADYSGLGDDSEAIYAEGQLVISELIKEPRDSALVIIDVNQTHASIANSAMFRKILEQSREHVRKRAVIGLTVSTRYFVNALIHIAGKGSITPCDSLEKALDWLVEDNHPTPVR